MDIDTSKDDDQQDFNVDTLNEVKDLMGDKFVLIVDQFLESSMGYIAGIEQGLKEENPALVASSAHPLKSSSASLGLEKVSRIAQKLEYLADEKQEAEGNLQTALKQLFDQLNQEFEAAETFLRKEVDSFKAA